MKAFGRIALLLALAICGVAQAQDQRFDIQRFQVEGNTLLPEAQIEALVAPWRGSQRNYGDIQKALEALENAYRTSGYGTVQVHVPEQELTQGVVRLQVTEGLLGKVAVIGNKHFDNANIRAALPALQEGQAPNMRALSENIQVANENPDKQVEVTLGVSEEEGKVDAKVKVADENPEKFIVTVDNTGTSQTGKLRAGFAYRNANVLNTDQVMTLAYTDSPDKPTGVKVEVYSFAYRIPFYSIGDSLDLVYGKSSVNTPIPQVTGFNLAGKGDVLGLRWNHYFARRGEYTSKLIGGFDYKYINTTCTTNGAPTPIDVDSAVAGCTPYTLRPATLTYSGERQRPGELLGYSLGVVRNISLGNSYRFAATDGAAGTDRYSMISGNRSVPNEFGYVKASLNYLHALPQEWTGRIGVNAQYSATALPDPERIGIAGAGAVRGFNERAVTGDKGYFVNMELYTPELAGRVGVTGSLKAVGFYDFGRSISYGMNRAVQETAYEKAGISSLGAGLRYAIDKDVNIKVDLARVVDAGPANVTPGSTAAVPLNTESRGDWRGHFAVQLAF